MDDNISGPFLSHPQLISPQVQVSNISPGPLPIVSPPLFTTPLASQSLASQSELGCEPNLSNYIPLILCIIIAILAIGFSLLKGPLQTKLIVTGSTIIFNLIFTLLIWWACAECSGWWVFLILLLPLCWLIMIILLEFGIFTLSWLPINPPVPPTPPPPVNACPPGQILVNGQCQVVNLPAKPTINSINLT